MAFCLSLECISLAILSPIETKCSLHFSAIISLSVTSNPLILIFSIPVVLCGFPVALLRIFHVVFSLDHLCVVQFYWLNNFFLANIVSDIPLFSFGYMPASEYKNQSYLLWP